MNDDDRFSDEELPTRRATPTSKRRAVRDYSFTLFFEDPLNRSEDDFAGQAYRASVAVVLVGVQEGRPYIVCTQPGETQQLALDFARQCVERLGVKVLSVESDDED